MKGANTEKAASLIGGALCTASPVCLLAYLFNSGFKILRHTLGPHLKFFLVSLLAHRRHGLHIFYCFGFPVLSSMKCLNHRRPPCPPQGIMKVSVVWCSLTSVVLPADTVPDTADARHRRKRIRTSHSCG